MTDKENMDEKSQSSTNEENQTLNENENIENEEQPKLSVEEELQIKLNESNDKYLRLYSEFDNFRRRTAKEKMELISTANANLMGDLLSILDDFERAMKHNQESDDADSIKQGFELIYNKFLGTLIGKGLKAMESVGDDFDTELHEAIANVPTDNDQKGKIIDVTEKGYFLNEKVIRHAKVVVGQ